MLFGLGKNVRSSVTFDAVSLQHLCTVNGSHVTCKLVHFVMDFLLHLYTKNTFCVNLETSILPQLETVLFVFFSTNTETLDCLENPFDVCGLWMCRLGRHAFTLVLQSCYQLCFVFARGDMVPCFCGLELQSFLSNGFSVGSGAEDEDYERK